MSMSGHERDRFLAGAHMGVLSVIESAERAPLVTPVWFAYEPGATIRFSAETDERTLEAVRRAGRATLTVQEELPPQRCVSVEGTVIVSEPTDPDELRRWIAAGLAAEPAARYFRSVEDDLEHMTTVRMLPARWRARDLSPAWCDGPSNRT